ncbi:hypothetical protein [Halalkalicoccus jeotgali]|uniref:Uncharacterized protein n=1 Tax=Halalkalicoccus jeotgali (strain DSM 18796 / CECT 7217 / JCM 14584 / KCTC 4019 / B3) TaxID=795797 RepID=D8J7D2_HALJB|nr:hypothetical protein [Halalkalicoccus jeotgali]ADJ14027.1 hypothetical protein HacjB3_03170 [Halalkalicoccus jeotgali B3]
MTPYFTNERVLKCIEGRGIGGGVGHRADVGLDDADVIVESREAFFDALGSSASEIGISDPARIRPSSQIAMSMARRVRCCTPPTTGRTVPHGVTAPRIGM